MSPESRRLLWASAWSGLAGGLAGLGLGLLLAPDEGRTVRHRIAFLLDRWAGQMARLLEQIRAEEVHSDARESAAALLADAREQAERILRDANTLMEEVRQRPPAP